MSMLHWKISGPILAATLAGVVLAATSEPVDVTLVPGRGVVIDCPGGIARISTSSPEVVDAVTASNHEILFEAKALGQSTLIVWSKSGERTIYNVTVEQNLEPMRRLLRESFPGEEIDIRASRESMALVGNVSTQTVSDRALALVAASVKGAISNLKAPAPGVEKQVILHVKFAELNRTAVSEFGVNLLSTGALNTLAQVTTGQSRSNGGLQLNTAIPGHAGGTSTQYSLSDLLNIFAFRPDLNLGVIIRDLQTRGLLQVLAEPNLVASNGKEASFLAGGEFPIPVVQSGSNAGAVSVTYREFGIKLSFLPQLTGNNTIKLHVKPEVSTIDSANGIQVSGFNIPALSTRRIETDIELGPGQSFVIGGLIDDRVIQNLSQVPGLSHIPILGALFKSRSETKTKTELIVVVTPERAAPVSGAVPSVPAPRPFLEPAASGLSVDWYRQGKKPE